MNDSILMDIKKLLGIANECLDFDTDIIIHINTAFFNLNQIGIGPTDGYSIIDSSNSWSDYINDARNLESIKTYIYIKVKVIFDPPLSSFVLESYNKQIAEIEWRLSVQAELNKGVI